MDLDVWTHRSIRDQILGSGGMTLSSYHRWVGVLHILWDSRNGRSRLYKSCDPRPILLLSLLLHLSVKMNFTEIEKEGFEVGTARRRVKQRCARGQDAVVGLYAAATTGRIRAAAVSQPYKSYM